MKFVRRFHLHWEEDAPLVDAFGGFFWDGRTDSLTDLVKQPLLAPNEMNGGSAEIVAHKIAASAYSGDFQRAFGDALHDPTAAMVALGEAINAYLTSPPMAPFTSKYDDYIAGRATLTDVEARGLRLFKDSAKGGCAACHKMNDAVSNPERSLFTDYGYEALAPPRNRLLAENDDASHFDLGLCKRPDTHYRTDGEEFCGAFRTPSLRNVAVRQSFMHNGVFSKLRDAVSFYATRGTNPKRWYPSGVRFEDVPAAYREYVNVDNAPFNRQEGETPALDDSEIDAIVRFLETLTDAQYR